MAVIGIDQSAQSTGVAILDDSGKPLLLTTIQPPKALKDALRLQYIRARLREILEAHPEVSLAVMEGYSFNSTNKKFLLGEVGAVIKLTVTDCNIELRELAPKQLKKFVTGSGSASKLDVQKHAFHKWGIELTQNDIADAYGLARAAHTMLQKNSKNRAELEVLATVASKPLRKKKRRSRLTTFTAI